MSKIYTPDATTELNTHKDVTGETLGTVRGMHVAPFPSAATTAVLIIKEDSATTPGTTYYGWAVPGTATSAAGWKILSGTISAGIATWIWADSNGSFDNIWDNRASLSYG